MHSLSKKLNLKDTQKRFVFGTPKTCLWVIEALKEDGHVFEDLNALHEMSMALIFVQSQKELADILPALMEKLTSDALFWVAYPKKSSKRYTSDLHRDQGFERIGHYGYEPVRQIAIDEDFSALRFKPVHAIKTLHRSAKMALSKEAKKRIQSK